MSGVKRTFLSFSVESILSKSKKRKDTLSVTSPTENVVEENKPDSTSQPNTQQTDLVEIHNESREETAPDSTSPELEEANQSKTLPDSEAAKENSEVLEEGDISVRLLESSLWQQFSSLGTEMIITKAGRWEGCSRKVAGGR